MPDPNTPPPYVIANRDDGYADVLRYSTLSIDGVPCYHLVARCPSDQAAAAVAAAMNVRRELEGR